MKRALLVLLAVAFGAVALLLQAGVIGPRSAPSPAVKELMTASRRGDLDGVERALATGETPLSVAVEAASREAIGLLDSGGVREW